MVGLIEVVEMDCCSMCLGEVVSLVGVEERIEISW